MRTEAVVALWIVHHSSVGSSASAKMPRQDGASAAISTDLQAMERLMENLNAEHFACLEALILAKSYTSPSVPVSGKASAAPISEKPFFAPANGST